VQNDVIRDHLSEVPATPWNGLPQETIDSYILSFTRRLRGCTKPVMDILNIQICFCNMLH